MPPTLKSWIEVSHCLQRDYGYREQLSSGPRTYPGISRSTLSGDRRLHYAFMSKRDMMPPLGRCDPLALPSAYTRPQVILDNEDGIAPECLKGEEAAILVVRHTSIAARHDTNPTVAAPPGRVILTTVVGYDKVVGSVRQSEDALHTLAKPLRS
jgi:hypothetical protein